MTGNSCHENITTSFDKKNNNNNDYQLRLCLTQYSIYLSPSFSLSLSLSLSPLLAPYSGLTSTHFHLVATGIQTPCINNTSYARMHERSFVLSPLREPRNLPYLISRNSSFLPPATIKPPSEHKSTVNHQLTNHPINNHSRPNTPHHHHSSSPSSSPKEL